MIELGASRDGVLLPVRAQPGARTSALRGVQNGVLRVSVTQAAEKGKANKAIVALLAKQLGLRRSQIELVAGPTAANKRFLVRGIDPQDLSQRIETALRRIA